MIAHSERMRASRPTALIGAGVLLVIVASSAWVGRAATRDAVLLASLITTAGIFAIAGLLSRTQPAPRWAWWATAAAMAAVLLVGTNLQPPKKWADVMAAAWLLPWFMLSMGLMPARASRWCAVTGTRGGLIMIAMGVLLALIGVLAPLV